MFKKALTPNDWHNYVEERLSSYIDGQLSDEERTNVRKHLKECARCQTSLDSLGWTIRLLKQAPAPALPRQFTLPVPGAPRAQTTSGWLRWGLAAASAVAVFAFVVLLGVDVLSRGAGAPARVAAPLAAPATLMIAKAQPTNVSPAANESAAQPTSAPAATAAPPTSKASLAAAPTEPPAPSAAQVEPTEPGPIVTQRIAPATSPALSAPPASGEAPETATEPATGLGGGGGAATGETAVPDNAQPATSTVGPTSQAPRMSIAQSASAPTPPTPVITSSVIATTPLWVHTAPSTEADRIGFLPYESSVQIIGRDPTSNWLEIIFPPGNEEGSTGWIYSTYVNVAAGVVRNLPVVPPPTATPTPTPTPSPSPTDTPTSAPSVPTPGAQTLNLSTEGGGVVVVQAVTPPPAKGSIALVMAPTGASPPDPVRTAAQTSPRRITATLSYNTDNLTQALSTPLFSSPPPQSSALKNLEPQTAVISPLHIGELAALLLALICGVAALLLRA
jgi:anti-sigma factor RsiW/uncharacterized protein YraI